MAARLEGGCGPYRPARVDALPDGPGGLPTQFGGMCAVLAGNATPDCGAPDLPRSLFPALPEMPPGSARPVFYLYGPPMRLPSALLCHAAAAARRHTAYPSAKNTLRLRRNCFFVCGVRCAAAPPASALLRRGGPSGRPAEAWDGEERGGRGQVPPLRVSVGRAGPMGTRCSTRRGSRPKPQKRLQKWC